MSSLSEFLEQAHSEQALVAQEAWGSTLQLKDSSGAQIEFPGRITLRRARASLEDGGLVLDMDGQARWLKSEAREPVLGDYLRLKGENRILKVIAVTAGATGEWLVGLESLR